MAKSGYLYIPDASAFILDFGGLQNVLCATQYIAVSSMSFSRLVEFVRGWFRLPATSVNKLLIVEAAVPVDCNSTNPWIRFAGDFSHTYGKQLKHAYVHANSDSCVLPEWICRMPGMSGSKFRSFLNHLISHQTDARYLEIGSWKGSTACSAMYGNKAKMVCIDNWSLFGGPREEFFENTGRCLSDKIEFSCVEKNYREIDYSEIGPFNIYFYDGPHDEENQCHNQIAVQAALDEQFYLIVDDWNWPEVRAGTKRALKQLDTRIIAFMEIRTSSDNQHAEAPHGENSDWHNGYFSAICQKR